MRAVAIGLACAIGAYWGRRIAIWFGLCLTITAPLQAQTTHEGYPKVVVEDSARAVMIAEWDSVSANPYATERVFCAHVVVMAHKLTGQLLYVVDRVRRGELKEATQYRAVYQNCDNGEIVIHTHTPASCDAGGICTLGGVDSFDCEPSRIDYRTLLSSGHAFAGVQCSREAVRWFYNPSHSLNKRKS